MVAHPTLPGKTIHPEVAAIRAKALVDKARRAAVELEVEARRSRATARTQDGFFARITEQFQALTTYGGGGSQEAILDFQSNSRKHMSNELAKAKEEFESRDKTTVAVGPSFEHTERQALMRADRPERQKRPSFSISSQDMADYQKNLRVETSRELRRSYDEFQLRDTSGPTVPQVFAFEHTTRRAAIRASLKGDDAPRENFHVTAQDMDLYNSNLRKITSSALRRSYDDYQLRDTSTATVPIEFGSSVSSHTKSSALKDASNPNAAQRYGGGASVSIEEMSHYNANLRSHAAAATRQATQTYALREAGANGAPLPTEAVAPVFETERRAEFRVKELEPSRDFGQTGCEAMNAFNKNLRGNASLENAKAKREYGGRPDKRTLAEGPTFASDARVEDRKALLESGKGFGQGPEKYVPPSPNAKPWVGFYASATSKEPEQKTRIHNGDYGLTQLTGLFALGMGPSGGVPDEPKSAHSAKPWVPKPTSPKPFAAAPEVKDEAPEGPHHPNEDEGTAKHSDPLPNEPGHSSPATTEATIPSAEETVLGGGVEKEETEEAVADITADSSPPRAEDGDQPEVAPVRNESGVEEINGGGGWEDGTPELGSSNESHPTSPADAPQPPPVPPQKDKTIESAEEVGSTAAASTSPATSSRKPNDSTLKPSSTPGSTRKSTGPSTRRSITTPHRGGSSSPKSPNSRDRLASSELSPKSLTSPKSPAAPKTLRTKSPPATTRKKSPTSSRASPKASSSASPSSTKPLSPRGGTSLQATRGKATPSKVATRNPKERPPSLSKARAENTPSEKDSEKEAAKNGKTDGGDSSARPNNRKNRRSSNLEVLGGVAGMFSSSPSPTAGASVADSGGGKGQKEGERVEGEGDSGSLLSGVSNGFGSMLGTASSAAAAAAAVASPKPPSRPLEEKGTFSAKKETSAKGTITKKEMRATGKKDATANRDARSQTPTKASTSGALVGASATAGLASGKEDSGDLVSPQTAAQTAAAQAEAAANAAQAQAEAAAKAASDAASQAAAGVANLMGSLWS